MSPPSAFEMHSEEFDSEDEMRELEARLYSQIHYGEDEGEEEYVSRRLALQQPRSVVQDPPEPSLLQDLNCGTRDGEQRKDCTQTSGDVEPAVQILPEGDEVGAKSPPPPPVVINLEESSSSDDDSDGIVVLSNPEKVANANRAGKKKCYAEPKKTSSDSESTDSDSDSVIEVAGGTAFPPTEKEEAGRGRNEERGGGEGLFSLSRLAKAYKRELAKKEIEEDEEEEKNSAGKPPHWKRPRLDVARQTASSVGRSKTSAKGRGANIISSSGSQVSSDEDEKPTGKGNSNLHINVVGGSRNGGGFLLSVSEAVGSELAEVGGRSHETGAPVPEKWTDEMARFYNEPVVTLGPQRTLAQIHASMPDDPDRWRVDKADLYRDAGGSNYGSNRRKRRYFNHPQRCNNCEERGHIARECTGPRKAPTCIMCGREGHLRFDCPDRKCLRCGTFGPPFTPSCSSCRHLDRYDCARCGAPGHLRSDCPDNWRRYHSTVASGPAVAPNRLDREDPHLPESQLWCPNCARRGHHLHRCRAYRNSPFPFFVRSVVSYDDGDCEAGEGGHAEMFKKSKRQRVREMKAARKAYKHGSVPGTPAAVRRGGGPAVADGWKRRNGKKYYFHSEPSTPKKVSAEDAEEVRKRLAEASEVLSARQKFRMSRREKRQRKKKEAEKRKNASGDEETKKKKDKLRKWLERRRRETTTLSGCSKLKDLKVSSKKKERRRKSQLQAKTADACKFRFKLTVPDAGN